MNCNDQSASDGHGYGLMTGVNRFSLGLLKEDSLVQTALTVFQDSVLSEIFCV